MEITSGVIPTKKKVVVYGPEGIGKSTFASMFPDPVFIDTEGSTKSMDVRRFKAPKKWDDIKEAVKYVKANPDCCKTLVIDTADWAETLCTKYTCEKGQVDGIEGFGYGRGYTYLAENFQPFLLELENIIDLGINVVVTAHAKMRKFEQPDEMGAYDRWEMKLTKYVAPLLKEWADMVLFVNYKTYVVEDDKTKSKKAQGGKRVMYTTHSPCWDAKNRYGLPDCVPFEYKAIKAVIEGDDTTEEPKEPPKKEPKKPKEKPKEEPKEPPKEEAKEEPKEELEPIKDGDSEIVKKLKELMNQDGISRKRLEYAVATKGAYFTEQFEDYSEDFIQKSLIDKWARFAKYAKKFTDAEINVEELPFK